MLVINFLNRCLGLHVLTEKCVNGGNYLKAVADNAASGLGKKLTINLNSTPFINITWKVEKDLKGINEKSKKGHDYAARLFVIKKTGATTLKSQKKQHQHNNPPSSCSMNE